MLNRPQYKSGYLAELAVIVETLTDDFRFKLRLIITEMSDKVLTITIQAFTAFTM